MNERFAFGLRRLQGQFSSDIKQYIAQSLSPAKNLTVEINEEEKVARVFVPKDELSLAIGKDGQNVRLAYKLTKYRIEIEGNEEASEEAEEVKVEEVKTEVAEESGEVAVDVSEDSSTSSEQEKTE